MTQVYSLGQLREWKTRRKNNSINLMKKHGLEGLAVVEERKPCVINSCQAY